MSCFPYIIAQYQRSGQTIVSLHSVPLESEIDSLRRALGDALRLLSHSSKKVPKFPRGFIAAVTKNAFDCYENDQQDLTRGVVFGSKKCMPLGHTSATRSELARLMFGLPWSSPSIHISCTQLHSKSDRLVELVTLSFEETLLFGRDKPGWNQSGRALFSKQVHTAIDGKVPIRFALPAFPCKSTNKDKVYSTKPDGAEFQALTNLCTFAGKVAAIYPIGAEIVIVSDGHVFSDCTGVDDEEVNRYNEELQHMLAVVKHKLRLPFNTDVSFRNLKQLLSMNENIDEAEYIQNYDPSAVHHPVRTTILLQEDASRQKLLEYCAPPKDYIRDLINEQPDHPTTCLYRGFHRFMLDDLKYHVDIANQSQKQRAAVASHVALEMIIRNQAYSRLVELLFPTFIRLSIHAHDNAGPKFAVNLIPRARTALSTEITIPTPWHSCLAVLDGDTLLVDRAEVFRRGLACGQYRGSWCTVDGGFFELKSRRAGCLS